MNELSNIEITINAISAILSAVMLFLATKAPKDLRMRNIQIISWIFAVVGFTTSAFQEEEFGRLLIITFVAGLIISNFTLNRQYK